MQSAFEYILTSLQSAGNDEKAMWLENYVKHDIQSLGVGIPEIRTLVKDVALKYEILKMSRDEQEKLYTQLMQNPYTEMKLAAVLFLQLFHLKNKPSDLLGLMQDWFDNKYISDWNVCDWLCVRVLTPLLDAHAAGTIPVLKSWNQSPYLWMARASLVPFAQSKNMKEYSSQILDFSETLISRPVRFCKTSVGWVLREYWKHDSDFVLCFLEKHKNHTTPEVVKNATKYKMKLKS